MGNGLTRNGSHGKIAIMSDLRAELETAAAFFVGKNGEARPVLFHQQRPTA